MAPPRHEAVGMARMSQTSSPLIDLTTRPHGRPQPTMDKPKREAILDLAKYVNERIRVKFTGGREGQAISLSAMFRPGADGLAPVTGVLKGFDQLLNLVLDEVQENLQVGKCPLQDVTSLYARAHISVYHH